MIKGHEGLICHTSGDFFVEKEMEKGEKRGNERNGEEKKEEEKGKREEGKLLLIQCLSNNTT